VVVPVSRLQLQGDPFQYDTHIQHIRALAKLNDLDRIRHARQKFRAVFPLTEELWSEWIREEQGIASTPEAQKRVVDLYRLAVQDYLCERPRLPRVGRAPPARLLPPCAGPRPAGALPAVHTPTAHHGSCACGRLACQPDRPTPDVRKPTTRRPHAVEGAGRVHRKDPRRGGGRRGTRWVAPPRLLPLAVPHVCCGHCLGRAAARPRTQTA